MAPRLKLPLDAKDPVVYRALRDAITSAFDQAGVRYMNIRPRQRKGMLHLVVEDDETNLKAVETILIRIHDPSWKGFRRKVTEIKGSALQIDTLIIDTPV